jgi:hypothetical protein
MAAGLASAAIADATNAGSTAAANAVRHAAALALVS